jgi:hypothetical protein
MCNSRGCKSSLVEIDAHGGRVIPSRLKKPGDCQQANSKPLSPKALRIGLSFLQADIQGGPSIAITQVLAR